MNIIEVSALNIPELSIYTSLTDARLRRSLEAKHGIFIAESPTVIEVALDSGCKPVSVLTDRRYLKERAINILSRCADIPVYVADREIMAGLTGFELTRGMLCAMERPEPKSPEAVCLGAERVAVLADIADVTNVGAIIRSAAALDIDAVLITPECCDPLCRRAIRVSMGTVFRVPWCYTGKDWLSELKGLGFKTAAMALSDNSVSVDNPALMAQKRLAIVLGSEGYGLPAEIIAACDYTVRIPMSRGVDSLNVAAASAVAFWQLRKNRS